MIQQGIRAAVCCAAAAAVACFVPRAVNADVLLSGFEGNLSSSTGLTWGTSLPRSFVATGVTQGSSALQLTHGTNWAQDFILDGGAIAGLVAGHDKFSVDATTPATTVWRELFIIMQGDGLNWDQRGPFALPAGATTTVTLDLQATGIKAAAANGNESWWQVLLVFQGADTGAPTQITTTIDNIRFSAIPEPATAALAGAALLGVAVVARRRK
jgi:hypothetical protein